MLGVSSNIIGHIPRAHSKHDGLIPCCWDGDERQQIVICEHCGAAYIAGEMLEFYRWSCYDCNNEWFVYKLHKYGEYL